MFAEINNKLYRVRSAQGKFVYIDGKTPKPLPPSAILIISRKINLRRVKSKKKSRKSKKSTKSSNRAVSQKKKIHAIPSPKKSRKSSNRATPKSKKSKSRKSKSMKMMDFYRF
jgi:hypothetical protein